MVPVPNYPIYKRIFTNICSLFPSPNFLIMIVPTQVARFKKSVPYFCPSPSPGVCLEKSANSGYQSISMQGEVPLVSLCGWLSGMQGEVSLVILCGWLSGMQGEVSLVILCGWLSGMQGEVSLVTLCG